MKLLVLGWAMTVTIFGGSSAFAGATVQDLDAAISKSDWDDAIETAHEILSRNPKSSEAKLKGAYALFQKGYSNSALILLRTLSTEEWKSLPQGRDRFVEVVSLFQKKVPLNFLPWRLDQMDIQETSSYMTDELRYLKGKAAYEHHRDEDAKNLLESVSKNSRFYAAAHYLLGSISADSHEYTRAASQFAEVFQPAVLDQAAEFWKDVGSQMTSHWGSNFKVMLDTELLSKNEQVAELSLLALARVAYASKDYETALKRYSDIPSKSAVHSRAVLEKIWTLWALNRHADAQKVAAELATEGSTFSTVEAHILRALVLTDSGQTEEARKEIESFNDIYTKSKAALSEYQQRSLSQLLPPFIQFDLDQDAQLQALKSHQKTIGDEIKAVRAEDQRLFPVYSDLAAELDLWKSKSVHSTDEIIHEHVNRRMADLDRLNTQSKLIVAETYLEDREQLKTKIKGLKITDELVQRKYDESLIDLLTKAINITEEPLSKLQGHHARLQFREAELLWELGTAKLILGQGTSSKELDAEGDKIRLRALELIEDLAAKEPTFPKYDQVLFFKGFSELELGRTNAAVQTFNLYVQKYPTHEHVPDAFRILGDLQFDDNHFMEAEKYYKKVLEFPDSPLVGYALYKLGWCAYNEKLFARALLALEKAYVWTAETTENKLLGLQKESRHDLISIYSEVGDDNKAVDYFKRFSTVGSTDWLVDLTKQYENNGQFEKAQNIYRSLIIIDPNSPDNMLYMSGIIQSAFKLQRWDLVGTTLKELVTRYGSQLAIPNRDTSTEFAVEKVVREVVSTHQVDFRRSADPDVIKRVMNLNQLYLDAFKLWPSSEEPLYRYAQYLLEKGNLADAKVAFKQHWAQFQDTLKEPVKEESLRNLIHTLGVVDEKRQTKEVNDDVTDIFKYAVQYRTLYPTTKYLRPIEYLYASTLLKYGHTEDGIVESQGLFDRNSKDEIGSGSFKNLSKAYYGLKDWQRTYNWAQTIKGRSEVEVQTIRQESYFLWAENTTDDVQSAELFLKAAGDEELKPIWQKSLYNAFIRYIKAGKRYEAIQAANKLEKLFPHDPSLIEIAGMRAAIYQEAGDYASALPLLEVFLKNPDSKTPPEAIQQAHLNTALIAEALGQSEKAKAHYKSYLAGAKVLKKEEAERGLARVATASLLNSPEESFAEWTKLQKEREAFVNKPLIPQADLVAELKSGATRLQKITQRFLDVANSQKTPAYYAVESYCTVPFFYAAYSKAVRALAGKDKDLQTELEKVAAPIDTKVAEFAQGCIDGAVKTETGGVVYEEVLKKWGWKKDPHLEELANSLTTLLGKNSPWLEPVDLKSKENEIITAHMKGEALDVQSWEQLARIRFQSGQLGLSRLTYMDALNRDPKSGPLLNGYACVEQKSRGAKGVSGLFKRAGELGSGYAWVNEALIQLKANRLPLAQEAFKKALVAKVFDGDLALKQNVQELTGP
jgi:TolA-binding protein/Tfp pilus assembly protein PilF